MQGLNLGRYIPLDVLINMLLANKDADIERLRKQLEELQKLLDAYESLELTPEQKRQLQKMVGSDKIIGGDFRIGNTFLERKVGYCRRPFKRKQ